MVKINKTLFLSELLFIAKAVADFSIKLLEAYPYCLWHKLKFKNLFLQLLLIAKSVAAGLSGSLAVISSVIDSAVDLVSGALMWWSGRAMKKRNIYQYPQGEATYMSDNMQHLPVPTR